MLLDQGGFFMNFNDYNELSKQMDGLVEYHAVHRVQRMEVGSDNQAHIDQAEKHMTVKRMHNADNKKKEDFVIERSEKHESKVFDIKKRQAWLKKL